MVFGMFSFIHLFSFSASLPIFKYKGEEEKKNERANNQNQFTAATVTMKIVLQTNLGIVCHLLLTDSFLLLLLLVVCVCGARAGRGFMNAHNNSVMKSHTQ